MNNELTEIIYSIVNSSYRETKDDLCRAVCDMDNMDSTPRCAHVSCHNCPIFASVEQKNNYPSGVSKTNRVLNES